MSTDSINRPPATDYPPDFDFEPACLTPQQEIRGYAATAASWLYATHLVELDETDTQTALGSVLDAARRLAQWIEHGDRSDAATPDVPAA